jgi:tellurite resistance protein TehA-like permease
MKNIISKLYSYNLIKVIFLLLLMILTKKISKSINNDYLYWFINSLGTLCFILIINIIVGSIIKKSKKQKSEIC